MPMKPLPKTDTRQAPEPGSSEGLADWVLDVRLIPDDAYRVIFDAAATGIAILDLDGRFLKVNGECCRILGYDERELPGMSMQSISPGDACQSDRHVFQELLAGRIAQFRQERQAVRKDARLVWIQLDVSLIHSADGEPSYFVCQLRDNTERARTEHALHESEERFRTLATHAPFGVFETSPDGRCTFVNRHWKELTGQPLEEALEFGWSKVVHPDDRGELLRAWGEAVREERGLTCEFRCLRPDGRNAWVFCQVNPMRNEAGEITTYLGNLVDVTYRKETEAELRRLNAQLEALATTDALTGLQNRRATFDQLATLAAAAERYHEPLSCLMIDIDHFKNVNDTFGHAAGDMVLREVAGVIRREARRSDLCGRFGGEEFLVLCPRTDLAEAHAAAERIRQSIASCRLPVDDEEIAVTVSIGVACCRFPECESHGLVAAADKQLYEAKRSGRNCTRSADRP